MMQSTKSKVHPANTTVVAFTNDTARTDDDNQSGRHRDAGDGVGVSGSVEGAPSAEAACPLSSRSNPNFVENPITSKKSNSNATTPAKTNNQTGSFDDSFHEASPHRHSTSNIDNDESSSSDDDDDGEPVPSQVNESFGDEKFSYFDAIEVLYFDDMIYPQQLDQQQQPLSSSDQNQQQQQQQQSQNEPSEQPRSSRRQYNITHKLRHLTRKQRHALKSRIQRRRQKLQKLLSNPVVVMTMDKLSFVFGVLIIMIIELVLLVAPDQMGKLYTFLLIPLMIARYVIYKADLYHYFMYDFCYFSQILLLVQMYGYPDNARYYKALFAITNGPLALAVVMWRNSLVFHSMDKMTSMFIHVLPSLVMFCKRWEGHLTSKEFPIYEAELLDTSLWKENIVDFLLNPFCYYILWQTIYLFKTEVISKRKLRYNTDIMTSLRWLTRKPESASYKLLSVFGERNQLPTFVLFQAVFTLVTFVMVPLLWHSFWLHVVYLMGIFVVALMNGAKYYFHVFAVRYIEEIGKKVEEERGGEDKRGDDDLGSGNSNSEVKN